MPTRSENHYVTLFNPPGLYDPAPNGYSHLALVPGGSRLALVAGQGGETEDGSDWHWMVCCLRWKPWPFCQNPDQSVAGHHFSG